MRRDGPLQLYLALSEMDRERSPQQRLSPQTVRLLAEKFSRFGDQYPIFSEFHALNNDSIARFLSVAEAINRIPDNGVRGRRLGYLSSQRRTLANPGPARGDPKRRLESVLAAGH